MAGSPHPSKLFSVSAIDSVGTHPFAFFRETVGGRNLNL
jgi:hypothetical protein